MELAIGIVDRPQKFVEMRSFLDRPDSIKRRPQKVQITPRQKADRDYSIRHSCTLWNGTVSPNAAKHLKCL